MNNLSPRISRTYTLSAMANSRPIDDDIGGELFSIV